MKKQTKKKTVIKSKTKKPIVRIAPMGIFATPKSAEALTAYIDNFQGGERLAAMTLMGMTWNYLASRVNQ
jgi:hypothetical protein